jgi:FdhD protein
MSRIEFDEPRKSRDGVVRPIPGQFGIMAATAERVNIEGFRQQRVDAKVIHEDALTIDIEDVGSYSLMWAPTTDNARAVGFCIEDGILADDSVSNASLGLQPGMMHGIPESLALAAGFAFTEGIVDALDEIAGMSVCQERPDVVRMRLRDPGAVAVRRRNVVMNSSCGVCGGREQLQDNSIAWTPVPDTLRMTIADFTSIREAMERGQNIFGCTGGAHGAVIFDAHLSVLAMAEDLGRHNALDKVIGYGLLGGKGLAGCGAFISSRISYEMVAKAVRAGFEILAAISAPTSLAIETAERSGITLCGFVRRGNAEIYTHPHRIVTAQEPCRT